MTQLQTISNSCVVVSVASAGVRSTDLMNTCHRTPHHEKMQEWHDDGIRPFVECIP